MESSKTQGASRAWIDAHSHWADPRLDVVRDKWMTQALREGLVGTLQGGVGPEDWDRQVDFAKKYPGRVALCFGLHPYWVAEHPEEQLETVLDLLSKRIAQATALGETGLDLRPQYESAFELQMRAFEAQLELAEVARKPLVLHLVQAFDEALRVFDVWGRPAYGGMVHSFNGSWPQAEAYLERGLKISVGGPLIREKNQRLKQAVQNIPISELLLETDLPDQPGDNWQGKLNPPQSLLEVAQEVGRLKKLPVDEVLHFTTQNFKTVFKVGFENP